jgi:hypothetical protein
MDGNIYLYRELTSAGRNGELVLAFESNTTGRVFRERSHNVQTLAEKLDAWMGEGYRRQEIPIYMGAPEKVDPDGDRTMQARQERVEDFFAMIRKRHQRLKVKAVE